MTNISLKGPRGRAPLKFRWISWVAERLTQKRRIHFHPSSHVYTLTATGLDSFPGKSTRGYIVEPLCATHAFIQPNHGRRPAIRNSSSIVSREKKERRRISSFVRCVFFLATGEFQLSVVQTASGDVRFAGREKLASLGRVYTSWFTIIFKLVREAWRGIFCETKLLMRNTFEWQFFY